MHLWELIGGVTDSNFALNPFILINLLPIIHIYFTTSLQASDAGRRGDAGSKKKYDNISGCLSAAGVVFAIIGPIIIIGSVVGTVVSAGAAVTSTVSRTGSCYYSYTYGTYRCY